jgi:hypothetical protein
VIVTFGYFAIKRLTLSCSAAVASLLSTAGKATLILIFLVLISAGGASVGAAVAGAAVASAGAGAAVAGAVLAAGVALEHPATNANTKARLNVIANHLLLFTEIPLFIK